VKESGAKGTRRHEKKGATEEKKGMCTRTIERKGGGTPPGHEMVGELTQVGANRNPAHKKGRREAQPTSFVWTERGCRGLKTSSSSRIGTQKKKPHKVSYRGLICGGLMHPGKSKRSPVIGELWQLKGKLTYNHQKLDLK